jgi:replicative DNA helicase
MMSDLRDSGALENIADKVLFVYRPEYYEILQDEYGNDTRGTAEIIISKNTSGPVGTANLAFIGRTASFRDLDDTEIVPFESSFTFDNKRLKDLDETPF